MRPVIAVRLECATAEIRALVVNALRDKANGDRDAAASIAATFENTEHDERTASTLWAQAELADQVADELEGA